MLTGGTIWLLTHDHMSHVERIRAEPRPQVRRTHQVAISLGMAVAVRPLLARGFMGHGPLGVMAVH